MERLIGTVRRECLDRVLIFGEAHLRRILTLYASYYNESRTHLSLSKDAPMHRAVQRSGTIIAVPVLGGLHHRYARMIFGKDRYTTPVGGLYAVYPSSRHVSPLVKEFIELAAERLAGTGTSEDDKA